MTNTLRANATSLALVAVFGLLTFASSHANGQLVPNENSKAEKVQHDETADATKLKKIELPARFASTLRR